MEKGFLKGFYKLLNIIKVIIFSKVKEQNIIFALFFILLISINLNSKEINFLIFKDIDINFINLEIRDTNNQLIQDDVLEKELESIFFSGLYNLLVNSEFYSISRMLVVLHKYFHITKLYITKDIPYKINKIYDVIILQIKHNLKILVRIIDTSYLLINLFNFWFCLSCLKYFTPRLFPMILRC